MNQRMLIVAGSCVAVALALLVPLPEGLSEEARRAAVIGLIMAIFWMTEAIPLPATAIGRAVIIGLHGMVEPEHGSVRAHDRTSSHSSCCVNATIYRNGDHSARAPCASMRYERLRVRR